MLLPIKQANNDTSWTSVTLYSRVVSSNLSSRNRIIHFCAKVPSGVTLLCVELPAWDDFLINGFFSILPAKPQQEIQIFIIIESVQWRWNLNEQKSYLLSHPRNQLIKIDDCMHAYGLTDSLSVTSNCVFVIPADN